MSNLIIFIIGTVFGVVLLFGALETRDRGQAKRAKDFFSEQSKIVAAALSRPRMEPAEKVFVPGSKSPSELSLAALTEKAGKLEGQLAGCGAAALGMSNEPAKQGDYGWSPAYQSVLELRKKYDALLAEAVEHGFGKAVVN